jgi:hypothetical protein
MTWYQAATKSSSSPGQALPVDFAAAAYAGRGSRRGKALGATGPPVGSGPGSVERAAAGVATNGCRFNS